MTARVKTSSFITELPLKVSPQQEGTLLKRLEAGRQLYNAVLGEAVRRLQLIRQSKIFQTAIKLRKDNPNRKKLFTEARNFYQ
jgi:hypothetical protein